MVSDLAVALSVGREAGGIGPDVVHAASLRRSIAFYQAVFGLQLAGRLTLRVRILFCVGPDDERIELLEERATPLLAGSGAS